MGKWAWGSGHGDVGLGRWALGRGHGEVGMGRGHLTRAGGRGHGDVGMNDTFVILLYKADDYSINITTTIVRIVCS